MKYSANSVWENKDEYDVAVIGGCLLYTSVRESYRRNEESFQRGLDLIVVVRPGAKEINYWDMESALLHVGKLHHIYKGVA